MKKKVVGVLAALCATAGLSTMVLADIYTPPILPPTAYSIKLPVAQEQGEDTAEVLSAESGAEQESVFTINADE